jgi:hypothetical protein
MGRNQNTKQAYLVNGIQQRQLGQPEMRIPVKVGSIGLFALRPFLNNLAAENAKRKL